MVNAVRKGQICAGGLMPDQRFRKALPPPYSSLFRLLRTADSYSVLNEVSRCGRRPDQETPIERELACCDVNASITVRHGMEADMKHLAGLLLCISLIQGCSTLSDGRGSAASTSTLYERRCGPTLPVEPLDSEAQQVTADRAAMLKSQFSIPAFETATALGVLPFLDRLVTLEDQVGPQGDGPVLAYVRERRHITDRITLGMLDVSSVAVE